MAAEMATVTSVSTDGRRQYGTGSVHQRRSDGRWIGTVEAGWTARGTRRRVTVSAATEAEAKRKLRDRQRQIAREGIPDATANGSETVKTYAERWLVARQGRVRGSSHPTSSPARPTPVTWRTAARSGTPGPGRSWRWPSQRGRDDG